MNKKYPIRVGIHETNSSSSHSFTLGPRGRLASHLRTDRDGVLWISTYDWSEDTKFNDPNLKLEYLLCFAYTLYGGYFEEDEEKANKAYQEYEEVRDKIIEVVRDFTGIREIKFIPETESTIDHQSTDIIDRRDLVDPEFIKEFIFNPDTWVYTIWDSYEPEDDFFEISQEEPVLYILRFPLPGIEPSPVLEVRYSDIENIPWRIDSLLEDYLWTGEKFVREKEEECPPSWYFSYTGESSWGEKKVEPEILFPNDNP